MGAGWCGSQKSCGCSALMVVFLSGSEVFEVVGRETGVDGAGGELDGDGDVGVCVVAQSGAADGGEIAGAQRQDSVAVNEDSGDVAVGVDVGGGHGTSWCGWVARPAVRCWPGWCGYPRSVMVWAM